MLDYLSKAVQLVEAIFTLVSKILAAVNGDESDEVKEMEETEEMVGKITDAVQDFAGSVDGLTK